MLSNNHQIILLNKGEVIRRGGRMVLHHLASGETGEQVVFIEPSRFYREGFFVSANVSGEIDN